MRRALAAALALAAISAFVPGARAEDLALAKEHFRAGAELYGEKRWREAIDEFEAAYRAKPHGAIHFNIAQCRERLEDWPLALRSWHDYLHEVPDAPDRAAVRASIRALEDRLRISGVQELVVYSDPPGALVQLDGQTRGETPFHALLPPGSYAFALVLDGYQTVSENIALAAGASRVVDVVLRPLAGGNGRDAAPSASPASAANPARAPPDLSARPSAHDAAAEPDPAEAEPAPAERRVYTWIAAGTAVAAASAGAYLGWSARRDDRAIDAMAAPDPAAAQRYARHASSKQRAANVLYAVAGAAGGAGVTLFFVERRF